jgi:alkanesulfonate monooxygenase SsuD/methylene tetrahydromethanopterin reductase-like flavin-dependent oxidoreductase (luciferase family)
VVRPTLAEGAAAAGRDPEEVQLSVTTFVIEDEAERAHVRQQIAFYASTPNYRPVLALHGWGEVADRLSQLARRGNWQSMASLIDDDMLDAFSVRAGGSELGSALRRRYQGLADRITLYRPLQLESAESWRPILEGFHA